MSLAEYMPGFKRSIADSLTRKDTKISLRDTLQPGEQIVLRDPLNLKGREVNIKLYDLRGEIKSGNPNVRVVSKEENGQK